MCVIGNGDIASVLPDREDRLYFASGVSNSSETRKEEFLREVKLLEEQGDKRHIVYFSSLAIFEKDSPYYRHKRAMEHLIKSFPHYTIIRLGNIDWGNNPNTLINGMKNRIKNGETLEIRNEDRYIISKEDLLYWVNRIPEWNCEMNIPGKKMKVWEVVKEYVL